MLELQERCHSRATCPKSKIVLAVTNDADQPLELGEIPQEELTLKSPTKTDKIVEVCLLDLSYRRAIKVCQICTNKALGQAFQRCRGWCLWS